MKNVRQVPQFQRETMRITLLHLKTIFQATWKEWNFVMQWINPLIHFNFLETQVTCSCSRPRDTTDFQYGCDVLCGTCWGGGGDVTRAFFLPHRPEISIHFRKINNGGRLHRIKFSGNIKEISPSHNRKNTTTSGYGRRFSYSVSSFLLYITFQMYKTKAFYSQEITA